jgi:hypothetical protein
VQATELLQRQFSSVNMIFHDVADDLSNDEWTTRILPETNLLGFDLWHVARTQDWARHTLVRGVDEVICDTRWSSKGALTTVGIGVGMTREEADRLAFEVTKEAVVAYADVVHATLLAWLESIDAMVLDDMPDIMSHYRTHPEYLTPAMQAEVPWLAQQPPVWRCLAPALGHVRDHLSEMDLLKRLWRRQQEGTS